MSTWTSSASAVRALRHRADVARQRPQTAALAVEYDQAADEREAILNAPQQPDLFATDVPDDLRAYLAGAA